MRECARISLLILLIFSFFSCSTTKYVPVETVKHDTTYVSKIKIDSVYQRDSVYIEHKGDTIIHYKYKYLSRYIEKRDTLWCERVDTTPVIVHDKDINNPALGQRVKSFVLYVALIFIGALLCSVIIRQK